MGSLNNVAKKVGGAKVFSLITGVAASLLLTPMLGVPLGLLMAVKMGVF